MRIGLIILALVVCTGCHPQMLHIKAPLQEQGEVLLYTRPFPQEAERLSFTLEEVAAVKDDGSEYPLALSLKEFKSGAIKRQRRLAAGELPPGDYVGLSFRVKKATLLDEEGEPQNLLIPKEAVRVEARFTVARKKAEFLSLAFDYAHSVGEGLSFTPVFTVTAPGRPVTGLVGYVSNYGSNTLTVFDKQYKEVVGFIATGAGPKGMAFDQQRKRAYVALAGEDGVEVLDITKGEVIRRIRLKQGDSPAEVALTPDGRLLLTVNSGSNTASIVDPLSFTELKRVDVGDTPSSILLDPTGVRAYVFNTFSTSITVIDIASRSVVAVLSSEPGLSRGQFNRRGDVLYTIHELGSSLRLLQAFSSVVQQRVHVGMGLSALKVDAATDLIYAGKRNDAEIEIYEPMSMTSNNSIASIRMEGGGTDYMTIDGEENNLYVVNGATRTLQVINLISREITAELDVGEEPYWVSLVGER